jgi:hypothetical protein
MEFLWLIIIVIIMFIFLISRKYLFPQYETMIGICGLPFQVIKNGGSKEKLKAANILCDLNTRCLSLIKHLSQYKTGEKNTKYLKLKEEYDIDDFIEEDNESFTVGKGKKIYICLRNTRGEFIDINTIMFVVLHELAHIITEPQKNPHTADFWLNNIWLLEEGQKIGIIKYQDYSRDPVEYCDGLIINSNPLSSEGFINYMKKMKYSNDESNIEGS